MQTKTCTKCNVEKALTEFYKNKNGKYGVQSQCKKCRCELAREYLQRPEAKERRREYQREYRQRPEIRKHNSEYQREYLQRPEVKEHNREYRQRPEVKERRREYDKAREELGIPPTRRGGKIANKHATRSGVWSDAEVQFLMTSDLPLADIALELGRTYSSVHLKRAKLRKQFSANTPS